MPRRDFSKVAFAATGDTNAIPTPTQPDGSISLQTGWGFDYQRDNGAGGGTPDPLAKNIDREDMNGILNEITASIGEIQQNGYPLWVVTAAPYPINALVRESNRVWRNTIANNSATPSAVSSGWEDFSAPTHGRLINIQVITTTTTYVPTQGMKTCEVMLQGAGGAGGGTQATAANQQAVAGGGGSGGFAWGKFYDTDIGAGIAVTLGLGGAASAGAAGGGGGASSFGSLMTAGGGSGGSLGLAVASTGTSVNSVGASASASGGNLINTNGIPGQYGINTPNGVVAGGGGGSPIAGGGGGAPAVGLGQNGLPGVASGAGGGGAASTQGSSTRPGGAGIRGICIVKEYS